MGDAGRKLTDDRQLAGLDQLVLGAAQRTFGANAIGDFVMQLGVGGGEVGGAFTDLALEFVVRLLQRLARRKAVAQMTAALVDHRRQDPQQDRRDSGHRSAGDAHSGDLFER